MPGWRGSHRISSYKRSCRRLWVWALPALAYPWNLVGPNGAPAASAARWALVTSPYAPVVGGTVTHLPYDPGSRVVTLNARRTGAGPTVLMWTSWTYPAGATLTANRPYRLATATTALGAIRVRRWTAVFPPAQGRLTLRLTPAEASPR
jgi:hypothetical protein